MKKSEQITKKILVALRIVTTLSMVVLTLLSAPLAIESSATGMIDPTTSRIELHKNNLASGEAFNLNNMFPGDFESRKFFIRVYHEGTITLNFLIKEEESTGATRLASGLHVQMKDFERDTIIYDSHMDSLIEKPYSISLPGNSDNMTDIYYEITAHLPTTAGNEYQEISFRGEFIWSIEGSEQGKPLPPPQTGDYSQIILYIILFGVALLLLIVICYLYFHRSRTKRKIYLSIVSITLLFAMLVGVTYALFHRTLTIEDNFFATGYVRIDLNNGERVFTGDELNLAPGEKITKPMTLKNNSSGPVYYMIYLENINGSLIDALIFNIYDGGILVKSISLADFSENNALISDKPFEMGAKKTFLIEAIMGPCAGNDYQDNFVTFDFVARAVQSRNNPNKEF